jgi:hypothetical protein
LHPIRLSLLFSLMPKALSVLLSRRLFGRQAVEQSRPQ